MDPMLALIHFGPFTAGALLNVVMLMLLAGVFFNSKFKINSLILPWIPLLLCIAISLFYTSQPVMGVKSFLVFITYLAAFIIPFNFIKSDEHFIECLKLIVYSSLIPILSVVHEFIFPEASTNENGFRLFGTFSHPNIFAFYLVTVLSVCFFVIKSSLFSDEIKFRRHCFIIMLMALICILGTKTRSAWIVIAMLVFIWGVFQEKKYLVYLFLVAILALMIPSVNERVFDLFQGNDTDAFLNDYEKLNSLAWRKVIWAGALDKYWEQPFFGFGYESFTTYSGHFFLIDKEGEGAGAHNSYVQLLFELGVVGLLAFIYFLFKPLLVLFRAIPLARENVIVFGLFLAYCLIHYSDNIFDYLAFNWYFWFFIGAFLAHVNLLRVNHKAMRL